MSHITSVISSGLATDATANIAPDSPGRQQRSQRRNRARSTLIWVSGALSVTLLLAALYLFFGALMTYGAHGAALIQEIYTKGLVVCL